MAIFQDVRSWCIEACSALCSVGSLQWTEIWWAAAVISTRGWVWHIFPYYIQQKIGSNGITMFDFSCYSLLGILRETWNLLYMRSIKKVHVSGKRDQDQGLQSQTCQVYCTGRSTLFLQSQYCFWKDTSKNAVPWGKHCLCFCDFWIIFELANGQGIT